MEPGPTYQQHPRTLQATTTWIGASTPEVGRGGHGPRQGWTRHGPSQTRFPESTQVELTAWTCPNSDRTASRCAPPARKTEDNAPMIYSTAPFSGLPWCLARAIRRGHGIQYVAQDLVVTLPQRAGNCTARHFPTGPRAAPAMTPLRDPVLIPGGLFRSRVSLSSGSARAEQRRGGAFKSAFLALGRRGRGLGVIGVSSGDGGVFGVYSRGEAYTGRVGTAVGCPLPAAKESFAQLGGNISPWCSSR
jgi:hypothetical protein